MPVHDRQACHAAAVGTADVPALALRPRAGAAPAAAGPADRHVRRRGVGGTGADRGAPWVSDFCETNVRTYVRDGNGRAGIWFFSLDAASLGAVAVAYI